MQAPKKHLVGLRVWSSVVHYIACGGGKFEICHYDIDLELKEKNRSPVLLWVLIWLLLCWSKRRIIFFTNLGKCWYKVRLTCTSHNPCFHPIDKFCSWYVHIWAENWGNIALTSSSASINFQNPWYPDRSYSSCQWYCRGSFLFCSMMES